MSSDRIITTGASGGLSANRREINDFVKDDKQFSLYVQALIDIMSRRQGDFASFFQVGGIHGLPYTPWNGAVGPGGTSAAGYCTHGSTLFPTWHRPYVALYEQLVHQSAQRIASQYTSDKEGWQAAAAALRQPYWDWAQNAVPPPEVISEEKVTITTPKGRVSVENPLRRYKFNPIDPSFFGPFREWQTTLRRPNPSSGPDAKDDVVELRRVLERVQSLRSITRNVYALLTQVHTWPAFSNHTPSAGGTANSLEAIHDGVHVLVGGGGHMAAVPMAAFDPIFYLHHANVDRILSLWSALNPGVWVTRGTQGEGTETIPGGSTVGIHTPLTPFWNTNTTFWLSSTLTHTTPLAYTYPEFNGLDMSDPSAVRLAISQKVNSLYGNAVFGGGFPSAPFQLLTRELAFDTKKHPAPAVLAAHNNAGMWAWSARVQFKQMELGESFSVSIFLGVPPQECKDWFTANTLVGSHHAFVNTAVESCANCQRHVDDVNEGFVHLNSAIAARSGLDSFEPNVVKPYLAKELHWRAQRADGTSVQLDTLEVVIVATLLTWPHGTVLPIVRDTVHHHDITRNRRGGSR